MSFRFSNSRKTCRWLPSHTKKKCVKHQNNEVRIKKKLREADKNSKDVVKELPKITDSDDLPVYLTRFRQVVVARGIDPKDWASLLDLLLTAICLANKLNLFKLVVLMTMNCFMIGYWIGLDTVLVIVLNHSCCQANLLVCHGTVMF